MNIVFVYIALMVAQFGVAGFFIVMVKYGKQSNLDAMVYVFLRDVFATILMAMFALFKEKKLLVPNSKKEILILSLMGFFGMFLARITIVWGIYFTSASISAIFLPTVPVWTHVFAIMARIEPLPNVRSLVDWTKMLGVMSAVGGAITMCFGNDAGVKATQAADKQVLGYFILFVNTTSFAVYILLQKKFIFSAENSRWRKLPFNVTVWGYICGMPFHIVVNLYNAIARPETFTGMTISAAYPICYGIFVISFFCYGIFTWANSHIKTTLVSCSWVLGALFSVMLAHFILGERLGAFEIVGGLAIIAGMAMVMWAHSREERQSQKALLKEQNGELYLDKEQLKDVTSLSHKLTSSENDDDART